MAERRVPAWYAATGLHAENRRVYEAFRAILEHLPMSYTELASAVGVSQPAISRWAADASHPSVEEMSAAYEAVRDRVSQIHEHLDRFGEVLRLIQDAMRLYESEVDGQPPPELERSDVTDQLRERLGLAS